MVRAAIIQQIYTKLAQLEDLREEQRINDLPTDKVDAELKELRSKLQIVMNSKCPVLFGGL